VSKDNQDELVGGIRKDGKPFKEGNLREDGSYKIGRGRTSVDTRFRADDGRARGRRPKGTPNLASDWKEELSETIVITENGKKKRVSKQRAVVKATANGAMKGQDRKIELVHRHAADIEAAARVSRRPDDSILDAWLDEQLRRRGALSGKVGDDGLGCGDEDAADEPDAGDDQRDGGTQ
jgi:hypothetical protein